MLKQMARRAFLRGAGTAALAAPIAAKAANRTIFEQISEWQSKLWGGSAVAQSAVRLGQRILA
jgi:hypothetical protein